MKKRDFEKALIFAVLFATLTCVSIGTVSAAQTHYVNPGESIQTAVDNADAGDTIIVKAGTYTESIAVYKQLTIQSENGADSTIVHAADSHIFNITADYVSIIGFTIEDASFDFGILLSDVNDCNISNNIVSGNYQGIYLSKSNQNTIFNNTAFSNENNGIYLEDSSGNRIIGNDASNSVNYHGISISSSNNNEIRNNTANSNHYQGIGLWASNENTIANNMAKNNGENGIYLTNTNNNEIYLNNFIDNANNVYSTESTNVWNSPSLITYTYNGNTYTNYMGNYWGDYTGTDGNGDGLGDSPYSIDSDKDDYPLMQQWEYYFAQPTEFRVHNINTGKDFNTIQAAIDDSATNEGDTITVDLGTYNENVEVTKSLTIRSTSGNPADTIVQAANTSDHVFEVTADYVNITGFTVTGATGDYKGGIYLYGAKHCNIANNNASNDYRGIYLYSSNNNSLSNNTAEENSDNGIHLSSSSNNMLRNNKVMYNGNTGIYLKDSNDNKINDNDASNNVNYHGISISSSNDNEIRDNIVNSNHYNGIGLYISSDNNTIAYNTANGNGNRGIRLNASDNNTVISNNASNSTNYDGIYLNSANNNEIQNNIANSNNDNGIELRSSNENIIANNTAKNNTNTCIYLKNSSNNRIIGNEAVNSANYHGISISSSNNNEIRNNTANYNHIKGIGLWTSSDNNIIANNTAKYNEGTGIYLKDSNDNRINDNDASHNVDYHGISVSSSNNNEIRNNTANSNHYQGICLWTSNENTIANNMAKNNGNRGIYLKESNNNKIYLNNFMNNANKADSNESTNVWNSQSEITYTYKGSTYTNYMGNYWRDYTGTDGNGDGLGDSPYSIDSDKDDYPLMQQWAYYFAQPTEFRVHNINTGKHFNTIQAAIDDSATNEGDTITVDTGIYNENVEVTKSLTIRSTSGNPTDTIVQAANTSDHVFEVTADYVNISGFTVTGATGDYKCGIYLYKAEHCNIANNNASNDYYGISLHYSCNNSLSNNTASKNYYGITLHYSCNNTFTSNTASNNGYGISLSSSCNNSLSNNTVNSNNYAGIWLYSSSNNRIYNNYFNNTINPMDSSGNNTWNITKTAGTNIIGGAYIGGNYWSDYAGEDLNGDGLGDTQIPYNSSGNIKYGGDYLPLVQASASSGFDTGTGTYPSIQGTHEGEIKPSCDIEVSKMYTYPCAGTGGHAKSIKLYEDGDLKASGNWSGYHEDWQNITITPTVTLKAGHEYRYVIETGSYPQIIHVPEYKAVTGGTITCEEFTDVNGRTYDNWIPAIRLE